MHFVISRFYLILLTILRRCSPYARVLLENNWWRKNKAARTAQVNTGHKQRQSAAKMGLLGLCSCYTLDCKETNYISENKNIIQRCFCDTCSATLKSE